MVALSLLSLLLAPVALAAPWRQEMEVIQSFQGACPVSASAFTLLLGILINYHPHLTWS